VEISGRNVNIQNMEGLKQMIAGCHRPPLC